MRGYGGGYTCDSTGCKRFGHEHDANARLVKNAYALPPRERLRRRGKAKPLEVSQIFFSRLQAALQAATPHQWEDQARCLLVEAMAQQRQKVRVVAPAFEERMWLNRTRVSFPASAATQLSHKDDITTLYAGAPLQ